MKRHLLRIFSVAVLAGVLLSSCKPGSTSSGSSADGETSAPVESEDLTPGAGAKIGDTSGLCYAEDGSLVYPYGRLELPSAGDRSYMGIKDAKQAENWNATAKLSTSFSDSTAVLSDTWDNGSKLDTTIAANADGSMTVRQKANSESGISGLFFSLNVPNKYDVIIPAWGGIRLTAEQPDIMNKMTRLRYPDEWQAQMFLIQGTNGGLLVYAKDDGTQFKALNVTNDENNFYLTLETIPQAPFDQYDEFQTVEWQMIPYKGDWMTGAMLYKDFADKTFKLPEIQEKKAEWISQIRLMLLTDIEDEQMLVELAKKVNPKQTLLIVPGWRKEPYDVNYPDYTPKEGIKEKIQFAKSLGYRVGLHFNMVGAGMETEEYKTKLKDAHTLDAYTKEPVIESYEAYGVTYRFSQINQASKAWRKILVEKAKTAVQDLGVDMIHLDQSLYCFNDGRGLVDGMTSMQGNVQLQKELAEALPNVAFSGEAINEMNMRYASFLQMHVYGLDSNSATWEEARFDQICPVTTAIFGDYTSLYHYPALPNVAADKEEYYQAWFRAGDMRCGQIPTLMRISTEEVTNPTETMEMVLKVVNWQQKNLPTLRHEDWDEDVLLSMVCKDGTIAEYRRDQYGDVLLTDVSKKSSELLRFVTGVNNAKLPGTITGWQIYDDEFIRGLDPEKSYLYSSTPRSKTAAHISKLDDNLTASLFDQQDGYLAVRLKEIEDTSKIITRFTKYDGPIRVGETLNSGETHTLGEEFNSKNAFWYTLDSQGQLRHLGDRFLMHPPWKDEGAGIGYTYAEFDATLDVCGNATFTAGAAMASAESAKASDGVIFKFFIWEKGDENKTGMLTKEVHATSEVPVPVEFDLVKFEGKTVTVRIECHPNKTCANDSSVIVEPQIVQRKSSSDKQITYTVTSDKEVKQVISSSGKATMKSLGNRQYQITSSLSDTVYLISSAAQTKLPADMTMLPFTTNWSYTSGETGEPTADLMPAIQVAEVKDELRQGIFAMPPSDGRSNLNYLVTLPSSGKITLTGAVGLKRGSNNSNGVIFGVTVNGKQLWSKSVKPTSSFQEFSISLEAYRGQTILITLYADANGSSAYDYAFWGDPYLDLK